MVEADGIVLEEYRRALAVCTQLCRRLRCRLNLVRCDAPSTLCRLNLVRCDAPSTLIHTLKQSEMYRRRAERYARGEAMQVAAMRAEAQQASPMKGLILREAEARLDNDAWVARAKLETKEVAHHRRAAALAHGT